MLILNSAFGVPSMYSTQFCNLLITRSKLKIPINRILELTVGDSILLTLFWNTDSFSHIYFLDGFHIEFSCCFTRMGLQTQVPTGTSKMQINRHSGQFVSLFYRFTNHDDRRVMLCWPLPSLLGLAPAPPRQCDLTQGLHQSYSRELPIHNVPDRWVPKATWVLVSVGAARLAIRRGIFFSGPPPHVTSAQSRGGGHQIGFLSFEPCRLACSAGQGWVRSDSSLTPWTNAHTRVALHCPGASGCV